MNRQDVCDECNKIYEAESVLADFAERLNDATTDKRKKQIRKTVETLKAVQKRHIGPDGINLPDFIKYQYDYLYDVMIKNGEIYGAYYKIKDILEILLKLPSLILLHGMDTYIKYGYIDENAIKLFTPFLIKAPSLGDWEVLEKGFKDSENLPVSGDFKNLYHKVLAVIKRIEKKKPSYQEFTKIRIENSKEIRVKFSGYRNAKMGHGATSIVIDKFFEEFKSFLSLLNSILDKSSYEGVHFEEQDGELYIRCDANEKEQAVTPSPYIKLGVQGAMPVVSMMESYYGKKKTAYLLNYNTGGVEENKALFETLQQVNNRIISAGKKIALPNPSSSDMRDDQNLNPADYASTFIDIPFVIENKAFSRRVTDWLNCERKKNNICFIQAERGVGKSVFARMNTHDVRHFLPSFSTQHFAEPNHLLVWSYIINDTFSSSENHFYNRLIEYFDGQIRNASETEIMDLNIDYDNAKSALRLAISNGTATGVIWHDYFKQLDTQIRKWIFKQENINDGEQPRLLFIIDGVDELDIQRRGRLHLEEIFGQQESLYVLLLGRKKEELVKGKETLYYYQILEELAATNYVIDRNDPLYVETLTSYIRKQIVDEVNVDVNRFLKLAEYRFVYVAMLCRISRTNPEDFNATFASLEQKNNSFLETYLNSICFIDEKYRNKLEQLLLILGLVQEPVTREELSYLLFNYDFSTPDFQINALLQDLGVVKSKRSAQGNTYLLENKIWYDEFETDIFSEKTDKIREELCTRAETIAHGTATCPHIKNWTVLFERFLDKRLYREANVVDNVLAFLNLEFDFSLYVQERLITILKDILEVNQNNTNLSKMAILLVKNWLAASFYITGRNQEGLDLMNEIANELRGDETITPTVKAGVYFNLGCFKEVFEQNDGTYPGDSQKLYEEAAKLLKDDSLWTFKCSCLYKLAKAEIEKANFDTAQAHIEDLEKIIQEKDGYETPVYMETLVLKYMLAMLKMTSESLDEKAKTELKLQAANYSQDMLSVIDKIENSKTEQCGVADKPLIPNLDRNFFALYQALPMTEMKIKTYQSASLQREENGEFAQAVNYIDKAIRLAKQAVSASALNGVQFEEIRLIPLQIEKLRVIVKEKLYNNQKIKKEDYIKKIEEIETIIRQEQELHGENSLIDDSKKQLETFKASIFDERGLINKGFNYLQESGYGNEYNIINTNILLAEKAKSDNGKMTFLEKAYTQAKKSLEIDFSLKGIKARQFIQKRYFEGAVLNNEAKYNVLQSILDSLCEAATKMADLYATIDPLKTKQYGEEAIFIYEVVLENEHFCTEAWLAKEEVKINMANCYRLLAKITESDYRQKIAYYDRQIDLLENIQGYIRPKFFEHAIRETLGVNINNTNSKLKQFEVYPVETILGEAYLEKAKFLKTRIGANDNLVKAVNFFLKSKEPIIINVGKKSYSYIQADIQKIDRKLAECKYLMGVIYFNNGTSVSRGMKVYLDKTNLENSRYCFEEMLKYARNADDNAQIALAYFYLSCVNATLFDIEATNDKAYDYFEKYQSNLTKIGRLDQMDECVSFAQGRLYKVLYYSLKNEMQRLMEKFNIFKDKEKFFENNYPEICVSLKDNRQKLKKRKDELKRFQETSKLSLVFNSFKNMRNENRLNEKKIKQVELEIENLKEEIEKAETKRKRIIDTKVFMEELNKQCFSLQSRILLLKTKIEVIRKKATMEHIDLNILRGVAGLDALDILILQKKEEN